jgi:inner membrane protein
MDTITHALFGLGLYGATNKIDKPKNFNNALLFTTLVASQIPDIDVVVNITETGRIMNQMWHRGLTHSIFLTPVWALLVYFIACKLFKIKDFKLYWLALISVIIHDTSDILNTWGTGYLEPFSNIRLTFGVIPIIDLSIWVIFLIGFIVSKFSKRFSNKSKIFKYVWIAVLLHVLIKSSMGFYYYSSISNKYDETTLAADFLPFNFKIIAKKNNIVDIYSDGLFKERVLEKRIHSDDSADLNPLFIKNPKAEVLMQWSPFVVIVNNDKELGVYDPRLYSEDRKFMFEKISK